MKSNEGKNCSKIPLHRKIFTQHDNNQLYGNIYDFTVQGSSIYSTSKRFTEILQSKSS